MRLLALVTLTLIGFSSNSLLTRGALGAHLIDPASFMMIRLASGAATLALLVQMRRRPAERQASWMSAFWLIGYAIAFTLAYVRIGAAVGALLLFGAVQVTMIGAGLFGGERPSPLHWIGAVLAFAGLVVLTAPGLTAPDPFGALLMLAAGVAWGAYSLAGRRGKDPLGWTMQNFVRATVLGLPVLIIMWSGVSLTTPGVLLALVSGSLASGVAYTLWYHALPSLAAWRAAVIQLIVPILTALAAAVFLAEALTPRLGVATLLVAGGVGLTIRRR